MPVILNAGFCMRSDISFPVAGNILVNLLDNHLSEGIDDGNDRDNHSEELGTD